VHIAVEARVLLQVAHSHDQRCGREQSPRAHCNCSVHQLHDV
jgi:hypothetical protein